MKQFALEYKDDYHLFCSQIHMNLYKDNPDQFFIDNELPPVLPTRVPLFKCAESISKPHSFALQGHCPVQLKNTNILEKGQALLKVKFDEQLFLFKNNTNLQKFMMLHENYIDVKLPVKIPFEEKKLDTEILEAENSVAFLEESLGHLVTKGLLEIACNRLKYPTLSVKETALKMLALFLKANNPNNPQYLTNKYNAQIQEFTKKCQIPSYLYHEGLRRSKFGFMFFD